MSSEIYAIVATTRYLLLVELNSRKVTPLEKERPEYYGISWFPESEHLVTSHSALDNAKLRDISDYANSEVGYIKHGDFNTAGFLSAPHQILCASDGRVVCTNTGRNSITAINIENPFLYHEVRISQSRWDRLSLQDITGDHLNSVFESSGYLYVIAHGYDKGSTLAILKYPELELLSLTPIKNRTGLHNIWVTDIGQKITCHSSRGSLIDIDSNEVLWTAGSQVYIRGLAASDEVIVLGESQITGREERTSSLSGLWIVDRKTYKALDYLCLGPYGAVNEVRLLNIPDHAHHGHIFKNFSSLYENTFFERFSSERLLRAGNFAKSSEIWKSYESIYGEPLITEAFGKKADINDLCLVLKTSNSDLLDFNYEMVESAGLSHVSVVKYSGDGADTNMDALILQRVSESEASLNFWTHNGIQWISDSSHVITKLPVKGKISVTMEANQLILLIDGKPILNIEREKLNFPDGKLGIRWIGSIITILNDLSETIKDK